MTEEEMCLGNRQLWMSQIREEQMLQCEPLSPAVVCHHWSCWTRQYREVRGQETQHELLWGTPTHNVVFDHSAAHTDWLDDVDGNMFHLQPISSMT